MYLIDLALFRQLDNTYVYAVTACTSRSILTEYFNPAEGSSSEDDFSNWSAAADAFGLHSAIG